ncbi:predicted protein [Nematostella vectensis]|uniref:Protein CUSTOS n=1 Tax=Nematostella vectensis TaxID=45351 RepID=A7SXL7_NEMVE|nr:protein CUSTOS [Nematostella vectensis]EDO31552.1 predicted protein [Nematostella vectensis]|eukprot:XP_001623652.1 predicted protein [Nematostella vectensis]
MASSSSDEDEEEARKLAEIAGIVDKEVEHGGLKSKHERVIPQKSLRNWRKDEEENEISDTLITPEFRKHVAKKLYSHLNSCIKETSAKVKISSISPVGDCGILLFNSSKRRIIDPELTTQTQAVNKRTKALQSDSSDGECEEDVARFAEAAVCGYTILSNGSSKDTKGSEVNGSKSKQETEPNITEEMSRKTKKKNKKKTRDREEHKVKHSHCDVMKRHKKKKKDKTS